MDTSVFTEQTKAPTNEELSSSLGSTFSLWMSIRDFVLEKYPTAVEEWNFSGAKYGWNFRIKDKKRAIIYLLPRDKYFKVAFVFGQKATDQVLNSKVSNDIKTELRQAKAYAEGRGIRIDVVDHTKLEDIKKLIEIKLAN